MANEMITEEELLEKVKAVWNQIKEIVINFVNKLVEFFHIENEKANNHKRNKPMNTKNWLDKKHKIRNFSSMRTIG